MRCASRREAINRRLIKPCISAACAAGCALHTTPHPPLRGTFPSRGRQGAYPAKLSLIIVYLFTVHSSFFMVCGHFLPTYAPARRIAESHTALWYTQYARQRHRLLGNSFPAAHGCARLMLLGLPPDMVHRDPLRGTVSSTLSMTCSTAHYETGGRDSPLL